ncbi:MAG: electron transport complex subunit RsxC [bacterium]|nr:electron transport complex subunit RsxC [bacterium]MDD5354769.1 electron transport complex subunit RsxC [bacterium]MDD5756971.1 electron transport complex subunit RsxC [bacterium]
MKVLTFPGGIHPSGKKELTCSQVVKVMPPPKMVVIPLLQHIGAICEPLVQKGDKVKKGQKIGESSSLITAPVHASISGTIADIRLYSHPLGNKVLSIIIESDGLDQWAEDIKRDDNFFRLLPQEVRDKIRDKGLVGLGGAAFPTSVKLTPPADKLIDVIIINGCECEPYLTCDHRLMLDNPRGIVEGLKIIMKLLDVGKGIIAIEDNKMDAIKLLSAAVKMEPNIDVVTVKAKYPQGAEKQLIKALLKKEVPAGKLPFEVGVVVDNVGTAVAIYEALHDNRPLIERTITVTGSGIKEPQNVKVRIGTLFSEVISFCGGLQGETAKVIMGGPMMGIAQYSLDVPVIKGTSGILVLTAQEAKVIQAGPCIRCSKCIDACPMNLTPYLYGLYGRRQEYEAMDKYQVADCIECGVCAYGCPAKIPLVQYAKWAKMEIAQAKKKKIESKKDTK